MLYCFQLNRVKIMTKSEKMKEQGTIRAHLKEVQQNLDRNAEKEGQIQNRLAARLKAGDRTAAAEFVDMYYQQIYFYMRQLGHNRQESEDLTQESFLNAWHHINQLRDGKALKGWIYRIAGNVSRLFWRRHKGRKAVSIEEFDLPASGAGDADKAVYNEQLEQLKSAIAHLPARLRQVVVLHYLQNLTIAEASEAAGVRQGTFKSRLSRALKVLRKHVV